MKFHRLFFYLLLLFLSTQLGFHFWPSWAMVLGRRVDYLAPTLYVTDILIILLLMSWLPLYVSLRGVGDEAIFQLKRSPRRENGLAMTKKNQLLTIKIVLVLIFIALNIFFAANRMVAIYAWVKVLEYVLLALYIIHTKPPLSSLLFCLSVGVFYSSVIAIAQFLFQRSIGGPLWFLGERTFGVDTPGIARVIFGGREMLRAYSTFPHPNVLGGFLAVTLPLLFNLRIDELTNLRIHKKMFVVGKWTVIGLGIIALFLTFSRSAWIVGLLGIIFLCNRNTKWKNLVPAFLGMTLLISPFFLFSKTEESVVVRGQLNAAAMRIFSHSPLVGVGLGNFLVKLPEVLPSRTIYFLQPVHNIYLLLLSEGGLVGLALFGFFLYKALLYKKKGKRLAFTVAQQSLLMLLILGLVDHYPLTLQQGQLILTVFFAFCFLKEQFPS